MIQFGQPRKTITLGKIEKKVAESIRFRVEQLESAIRFGQPLPVDAAAWLASISDAMHRKLAVVGLASHRAEKVATDIDSLFDSYIVRRHDLKPRSIANLLQAKTQAVKFFGKSRDVKSITHAEAKDFKREMEKNTLSTATIATHIKKMRQVFTDLVDRKIIAESPFDKVKIGSQVNADRMVYIPRESIYTIIESVRDQEWKLLFSLARFAGLRIPSEMKPLAWEDVLWAEGKMIIRSPKTEHHEGQDKRIIPIFPEVHPLLLDCFQSAQPGEKYVFARLRYRTLNTRAEKIIARAGVDQWPKLFQNLRSSCETDLATIVPLHVACKWIGNSAAVAAKHYLQVTQADFEKGAAKCAAVSSRHVLSAPVTSGEIATDNAETPATTTPKGSLNNRQKIADVLKYQEIALQNALQKATREADQFADSSIEQLKVFINHSRRSGGGN